MQAITRSAALLTTITTLLLVASPLATEAAPTMRPLPAGNVAMDDTPINETSTEGATVDRNEAVQRVFDVSSLWPRQREWARVVLAEHCTFDWDRLVSGLNGRKVAIKIAEPPARAMFYPGDPRVEVHRYYYRSERVVANRLLAWEAAHAVDIFLLNDEQRQQISELYHGGSADSHGWLSGDYEQQVGEAFMEGFTAAYCPALATKSTFGHTTTPEIAEGIKAII